MAPVPTHVYNALVLSIHDGDTLTTPVRLLGIDAPELATPTGPPARDHLAALVAKAPVVLHTFKDPADKYGRWLAEVFNLDGTDLCKQMVLDGFAVEWDGKGPKPS
jgi:endonuclease YncB( thermonuclease family)